MSFSTPIRTGLPPPCAHTARMAPTPMVPAAPARTVLRRIMVRSSLVPWRPRLHSDRIARSLRGSRGPSASRGGRRGEARGDLLRDRLGLDAARPVRVAAHPDAGLETLDGQGAVSLQQAMADIEAAAAELGHRALDPNLVTV